MLNFDGFIDPKKWAKAAAVRAVKTVVQTTIAMLGVAVVLGEVNWTMLVSVAVLAGVLSLLTSVTGLPEIKAESEEEW
ncbi:MAG: holin [Lachnospiraceae bacterium]